MSTLWISAGELSGDMQGGALLRELRTLAPDWRAVGMGGDKLAEAGQTNLFRTEELSIMGLTEVLGALPRILRLLRRTGLALRDVRPDALLLVDAPDFNFRVARMAYALGIPVYYFIPPKVWAWRSGRVEFLKRYVRHVFCILPFEERYYRRHGLDVSYVGNPLVDLVRWEELRHIPPQPGRIGLMPGSREGELRRLLPVFAGAAERLAPRFPDLSWHCMVAPNFTPDRLRRFWPSSLPLTMEGPETRYRFMRGCQCIVAASGTATLETALAGTPTLVAYKVSPLSYAVGRRLIRVPYISLTNLILGREAFPEHIQERAGPDALAGRLTEWLENPDILERMRADTAALRDLCGPPGSAARAAAALWEKLRG